MSSGTTLLSSGTTLLVALFLLIAPSCHGRIAADEPFADEFEHDYVVLSAADHPKPLEPSAIQGHYDVTVMDPTIVMKAENGSDIDAELKVKICKGNIRGVSCWVAAAEKTDNIFSFTAEAAPEEVVNITIMTRSESATFEIELSGFQKAVSVLYEKEEESAIFSMSLEINCQPGYFGKRCDVDYLPIEDDNADDVPPEEFFNWVTYTVFALYMLAWIYAYIRVKVYLIWTNAQFFKTAPRNNNLNSGEAHARAQRRNYEALPLVLDVEKNNHLCAASKIAAIQPL